jgi:FkbM family methyltransferase
MNKILINFAKQYNINISGIIHIGANDCCEYYDYIKYTNNIIYVEANPEIVNMVSKSNPNIVIYQALITDIDDEDVIFNISSNNSLSSSILEFNLHKINHPNINFVKSIPLKSITVDSLLKNNNINTKIFNILILDIQGIELRALKGSIQLLNNIDIIYTEVNIDETYTNCDKINDLDDFLLKYNFKRVYKKIWENHSYGDAIYIKNI